ncbi:dynein regulatory complex subunit 2-like [Anopheles nili]|uniref:dynein regulatory complex subunit 2-like n=1 Tax=Anopheles nili TaxID=185578 RepID=UPI00237AFB51|nr:dynein regulatory complex subunit 2-like [Anopheles nili]
MDNAEETDPEQDALRRKKQEKLLAKKAAAREAQNQLYRDHLARERGFSDETQRAFFASWETLCEQVRSEQLAEELRQQQQCFGTVIDRKNACIERLIGVRDRIGETHTKCLQRLGNIVSYYIRLKDFLTSSILERYDADFKHLMEEFRAEVFSKESFSCSQMEMLDSSLAELLAKMKQDELTDHEWFLERNTENISTQVEKCEISRDKKLAEMSALYRRLKETLDEFFQTILHPERKQSYDRLVSYTYIEEKAIEHRRCQLVALQLKKVHLEHSLTLAQIGGRRKLRTRHTVQKLLVMEVNKLKDQQTKQDANHQRLLRWICSVTHHLKELLTGHLVWGDHIAQAGLICTQYETDHDRQYAAKWFQQTDETDTDGRDHTFDFLTDKINRVEAINLILREQRDMLRRENEELKTKFKSYCSLHKISDSKGLCLYGKEAVMKP